MSTRIRKAGEFCWFNMLTPAPAEAREFYQQALGLDLRRAARHGSHRAGRRPATSAGCGTSPARIRRRGRRRTSAS